MAEQPNQRRWNDTISDLPLYTGTEKDSLSAESIVTRVEAAAEALAWTPEQTFNNFSLSLRSNAEQWLQLQQDIRPDFVKTWPYIKPIFRKAFGSKMDESKVYLTVKDLGMKTTEKPRDFAIRFNQAWRAIKEMIKPKPIDVPAAEADRSVAYCQGLYMQGCNDTHMDYQKIFYVAGLPQPLLTKVVQKDIPTFVEAMDQAILIDALNTKNGGTVHEIQEDQTPETSDEDFVNQIQGGYHNNRGNYRGAFRGRSNSRGNARGNRGASQSASQRGGNHNGGSQPPNNNGGTKMPYSEQKLKCLFCNIFGHHQNDCNKRIKANKPCIASSGKEYFPKTKVTPVQDGEEQQGTQAPVKEEAKEYLFR
jgi:hypothetical protein